MVGSEGIATSTRPHRRAELSLSLPRTLRRGRWRGMGAAHQEICDRQNRGGGGGGDKSRAERTAALEGDDEVTDSRVAGVHGGTATLFIEGVERCAACA
jgi:hypothetical protein